MEESLVEPPLLKLLDLPNEVIGHICTFCDTPCPSEARFNSQPSQHLTKSDHLDLKTISTVNKRLRAIVLPLLFRHSRLDPYRLADFLSLITGKQLVPHVHSVTAILQGSCNHIHPAWWTQLLNALPITTFTIICAPHVFAELTTLSMDNRDSWAFNMPYQTIRFRQDASSTQEPIPYDKSPPHILTARPWRDFSVNEGSSLKAYTTYEYFLRRTPSFTATLHLAKSVEADTMFANLTSFSFTAIFPFYNHLDEILMTVKKMKKLRKLSLKLCPEPESTVLDDEIAEAKGHIDVHDIWQELETGYRLVCYTVLGLSTRDGGSLQELHVDDMKAEGLRKELEEMITGKLNEGKKPWWSYEDLGVWKRTAEPLEND